DEYVGPARIAIDNQDNLALGAIGNIMRFNGALQMVANFWGGNANDLAIDQHGNTFIVGGGSYRAGLPVADPGGGAFMDNSPDFGKATGFIKKFDASNQLVWGTTLIQFQQTFMNRIVLDKTCDAVHVLGVMNDQSYAMPTVDNSCSNGFYYPAGTSPILTGPVIWTFKTSGQQVYTSLTNFPYEYYDTDYGFAIDPFGSLIFLFGYMRNFNTFPATKDPGGGAFFQPTRNNLNIASLIIKLNPSLLQASLQVSNPSDCSCSGSASVNIQCGTPPFTYQWSNGSTTALVTGLCSGTYHVQVTDNFCKDTTIYFTIAPGPGSITSIIATATPAHCGQADGAISITSVTGGSPSYSYSINGGIFQPAARFDALTSGKYEIRVKDQYGCPYTDSILIADIAGPDTIYVSTAPSACNQPNGSLAIDSLGGGEGPYTYQLDGSSFQSSNLFMGLNAGSHRLLAKDAAGCTTQRTVRIEQTPPPSADQYVAGSAHCGQPDGSITVSNVTGGTAPYTYSLDGMQFQSDGLFGSLHSGSYDLYILDDRGCPYKSSVTVPETAGPDSLVLDVKDALCDVMYGAARVATVRGGSAPYQYALDNGSFQSDGNFLNLLPDNHVISVLDNYGCRYDAPIRIKATHSTPVNIYPKDTVLCYGQEITFSAHSGDGTVFDQLKWDIAQQSAITYTKPFYKTGEVLLAATNQAGCVSWDTAFVRVKNCDSAADYCLQFPNAFTPNADGSNDAFGPVVHCLIDKYQLRVFNRYGACVFSSDQADQRWDGYYEGHAQAAGTFVYSCEYTIGAVSKQVKGTVMLVR
ncbi:MAG: gliding motility-associated C-terminal domain-containing protein, partial [Bacteroidota bacterium]